MVDRIGFEPICCPVCQTGDHPKQSHSPNIILIGFRVFLLPKSAILRFRLLLCDLIISTLGLVLRPASRKSSINIYGGQGGIRTHRTLILSQVSIPVPSPGHMCGFCLLVPQTRSTYAFLGVHTRQQHHWTTRIFGWVVVIISPVYF